MFGWLSIKLLKAPGIRAITLINSNFMCRNSGQNFLLDVAGIFSSSECFSICEYVIQLCHGPLGLLKCVETLDPVSNHYCQYLGVSLGEGIPHPCVALNI